MAVTHLVCAVAVLLTISNTQAESNITTTTLAPTPANTTTPVATTTSPVATTTTPVTTTTTPVATTTTPVTTTTTPVAPAASTSAVNANYDPCPDTYCSNGLRCGLYNPPKTYVCGCKSNTDCFSDCSKMSCIDGYNATCPMSGKAMYICVGKTYKMPAASTAKPEGEVKNTNVYVKVENEDSKTNA